MTVDFSLATFEILVREKDPFFFIPQGVVFTSLNAWLGVLRSLKVYHGSSIRLILVEVFNWEDQSLGKVHLSDWTQ
jgi:hypothetical protein